MGIFLGDVGHQPEIVLDEQLARGFIAGLYTKNERFFLLGGELPDGMRVADDAFDEEGEGIAVRVVEEDDLYLRDYVNAGIRELQQIAAEHGLKPDELRVCFAYDC